MLEKIEYSLSAYFGNAVAKGTTHKRNQDKNELFFVNLFDFPKCSSQRDEYLCFHCELESVEQILLSSAGPEDLALKLMLSIFIKLSPSSVKFWVQSGQHK